MLKVSLVNPYWGNFPSLNLGLSYLASSLEHRHKVRLLDMTFHRGNSRPYIFKELRENMPDVVGISINSFSLLSGLQIAGWIKQFNPNINIILGGVHPTLLPEETIKEPHIDAICIGEGEESFLEYLDRLQEAKAPDVPGIWYKTDGQIVRNPLRPFKEDLDDLPFPNWGYWDLEKYLKTSEFISGSLPHLASRGCPYHCTFCSAPAIAKAIPGKYYRTRSPEKIIEEIKVNRDRYARIGFKNLSFFDSTFGLNRQQMEDFCQLYIKEGLNKDFSWFCQTRADVITRDWAKTIADAGCNWVILGIESGDDYIRNQVYKKDISYQQIIEAAKYLRENDILCSFTIIIGCPEDTEQTIIKSMKLMKEINPHDISYSLCQPLPKIELMQRGSNSVIGTNIKPKIYSHKARIASGSLDTGKLNGIMRKIRIRRVYNFFKQGFQLKGWLFIFDIIKNIVLIYNSQIISLQNPYVLEYLEQTTVFKYLYENWKNKYKVRLNR